MTIKKYLRPFSIVSAALLLSAIIIRTVSASTTVGTDITTGGILTVNSSTATSTFANGIDLTGGCFEVNGGCLSSSGGGGTSPAAASGTIQYNKNGSFGGSSGLTYDGNNLTVNGTTTTGGLVLAPGGIIKIGSNTLIDSSGNLNAAVIPLQDTAANLSGVIPASGQMVYETDTKYSKVGDGVTTVGNLSALGSLSIKNGNAGLGTTSPQFPLDLYSTGSDGFVIGNSYAASGVSNGITITGTSPSFVDDIAIKIGVEDSDIDILDGENNINIDGQDAINLSTGGNMTFKTNGNGNFQFDSPITDSNLDTGTGGNALCIDGGDIMDSGGATCTTSSRRFKHDIQPLTATSGLSEVMALQPVDYVRNQITESNPYTDREVGLIAEDVLKVDPRLIFTDEGTGTPRGVRYEELTAVLIKAIQEQQAEIDELKSEIQASK